MRIIQSSLYNKARLNKIADYIIETYWNVSDDLDIKIAGIFTNPLKEGPFTNIGKGMWGAGKGIFHIVRGLLGVIWAPFHRALEGFMPAGLGEPDEAWQGLGKRLTDIVMGIGEEMNAALRLGTGGIRLIYSIAKKAGRYIINCVQDHIKNTKMDREKALQLAIAGQEAVRKLEDNIRGVVPQLKQQLEIGA